MYLHGLQSIDSLFFTPSPCTIVVQFSCSTWVGSTLCHWPFRIPSALNHLQAQPVWLPALGICSSTRCIPFAPARSRQECGGGMPPGSSAPCGREWRLAQLSCPLGRRTQTDSILRWPQDSSVERSFSCSWWWPAWQCTPFLASFTFRLTSLLACKYFPGSPLK